MATRESAAASDFATTRPMPPDPPVIIETLSERLIVFIWAIVNITKVRDAFKKHHCDWAALVIISIYMVIACKKFMVCPKSKQHR